jgi:hypothetical protein
MQKCKAQIHVQNIDSIEEVKQNEFDDEHNTTEMVRLDTYADAEET